MNRTQITARINLDPTAQLLSRRGLQPGGKVQKYIDSECIRQMKPYTPFLNGILVKSATIDTVIGSGIIRQNVPYAHYQYTGIVYGPNFPKYDDAGEIVGWASPPKKYKTNRHLEYNSSRHPKAGKEWFRRMAADKKTVILRGAAELAGGRAE